jgi:hypothetical protein
VRDEPTPRGQHLVIEALGSTHEVELPLVGGFPGFQRARCARARGRHGQAMSRAPWRRWRP